MRDGLVLLKGAADVCLFVEDVQTATYFNHLVALSKTLTKRIKVYVAGGREGVSRIVRAFDSPCAIGWVDRDFEDYDRAQWDEKRRTVLQSARHEIENYFLSGHSMATSWIAEDAQTIDEMLFEEARKQPVWLACRAVLFGLHRSFQHGFVGMPGVGQLKTENEGRKFLLAFPWRETILSLRQELEKESIERLFDEKLEEYRHDLSSGNWRECFSGKEIFNAVTGCLHKGSHGVDDVIKTVAENQIKQDCLPVDIKKLFEKINGLAAGVCS